MRICLTLFFCIVITSCNYFNFKRENEKTIFENRLAEIKKNGLELYPQIDPCEKTEGRKCFEKQLNSKLKQGLEEIQTANLINTNDTIWLSIEVNNKGQMTLRKNKFDYDELVINSVKNTLDLLSPIIPGTINGKPVNCTFKVPLLLKINN